MMETERAEKKGVLHVSLGSRGHNWDRPDFSEAILATKQYRCRFFSPIIFGVYSNRRITPSPI